MSNRAAAEFAGRLAKLRAEANLSQSELAEKSGLPPSAISHFEKKRRLPSYENLLRLADALNISIDFLLGRADNPQGLGPLTDQINRDFQKMSAEDQELMADMAARLAARNEARKKG